MSRDELSARHSPGDCNPGQSPGPQPLWFDTHAHLSDSKFDADRDAAIVRAFESGVEAICEIADGPEEWPKARALAERYAPRIWWAAGIHPYYADQGTPEVFAELKDLASHPQFVAIGEVGLDYAKSSVEPQQQIRTFAQAIELALSVDKPLIVHCREAYRDLIPTLQPYFGCRTDRAVSPGVVHCFSGTKENALQLLDMGFFLGVDGPLTYRSADALREAIADVPLDSLVLETDSPYLPPQTHRGQRNEPLHVAAVGGRLAVLRQIRPPDLARRTTENGFRLYRIKQPVQ